MRVGFAAETQDLLDNARSKLQSKALDLMIANDVTSPGSGFATDTNRVTIVDRSGHSETLPLLGKDEVAERVLDRLVSLIASNLER